jgi:hypothetical protein
MKSPCKIQDKNNQFLCNRPDGPLKASPRSVLQINIEDFRTSEQHRPDARSISIQQGVCFQKSTLFEKSLQAVRTTWQHVRAMSSSSEYSRVPFELEKDFSEYRPDVNLIKIELHCF